MISVKNITKKFGSFTAVDDLSFEIAAGDVVGFLGPNGAGKSTTMKMLTGFLDPDEGDIRINGVSVLDDAVTVQRQIGYLPEGAPAYGDMTALQFLDFIADVRGIQAPEKQQKIADVINKVQLESVLDKPIENLSKGFKRRVGLAQAILHDPDILILDEPTDGLDPNQKHQVRSLIKNIAKDKIVIVSTHILEEVTAVCNRVMIISNGRKCFDDTPEKLLQQSKYYNAINISFEQAIDEKILASLKGIQSWELDSSKTKLLLFPENRANVLHDIHQQLDPHGIAELYVEQGRLDEVFREITGAEVSQ
ncbi:MAG: ABC transporter ATP-binding protein [Aestuariibacter sp.]